MIVPLALCNVINKIPFQFRGKGQAFSIKALHRESVSVDRSNSDGASSGAIMKTINGLRPIGRVQPDIREHIVTKASGVTTVSTIEVRYT